MRHPAKSFNILGKTDCKVSSAINVCNGSVHNLKSNHFNSYTYPQRDKSREKEKRAKGTRG